MIYSDDPNFREFESALNLIESKYGSQMAWLKPLSEIDADLAGKCKRQLERTHSMIREEEPLSAVSAACASMVKGINAALQKMAGKAKETVKDYVVTKTPEGIKVRVYADRAAIPDTDGMGDIAMVAAEDLVKFIPADVMSLLKAFPGASVSKMLDQRKDDAVAAPVPSGSAPMAKPRAGSSKAMQAILAMPDDIPA